MKRILLFILLTSLTFGQSDLLLMFDDADSVDSPTLILAVGDVAKITLSWTNAGTYDSVKIYRGTSTDPTTLVYTLAGATTSKIDSALTEETIYYYRIKGKVGSNLSSYSSNASDTVLAIMYAVDLDGSTEYMSKTTPVDLDLNGTERITNSIDRDMEAVSVYSSDFSAGLNGWSSTSGNIDGIWGKDNVLRFVPANTSEYNRSYRQTGLTASVQQKVSFWYYIPSGNTCKSIRMWTGDLGKVRATGTVTDAWTQIIVSFTNSATTRLELGCGAVTVTTDSFYFKDVKVSSMFNYASNGNHTVDTSTVDKHAGTYSMTITSSAAGDATTNYVSLASSEFTTLVSGEKYTLEAWMRGTGIVSGSDLCLTFTNGATNVYETFTTANDSISSAIETGTNGAGYSNDLGSFAVGDQYQVTFSATLTSGTAPTVGFNATNNLGTVIGTFQTVTAGANTLYFYITAASTVPVLTFKNTAASVFTINDVDVKKVTAPTCTLAVGNQTKVTTNISCVPVAANWTKVVWNFQATANEVNQPIKIFYNQADVVYVDDVSIKQKYDLMINLWVKMSRDGGNDNILSNNPTNAITGCIIKKTTTNKMNFVIGDGVNVSSISPTTTYTAQTTFHFITATANIDSTRFYVDGVWELSEIASTVGIVPNSLALVLGRLSYLDAQYFSGQIGETQITRFTDIATSNYTPLQIYNRSKAKLHFYDAYTGGTIVGWWKWSGATDEAMLQDYSASGNNLTGNNVSTADQIIITGGY